MLNYSVLVWNKTNHLSENFVLLSAERCPFSAWFPASKSSIFATFPPTFPNRSPHTKPHHFSLSGASFAVEVPTQIPCASPVFCSFRGILRIRIPNRPSHVSLGHRPLQRKLTGIFSGAILCFLIKFNTFLKGFYLPNHKPGGFSGGEIGIICTKNPLDRGGIRGDEQGKI